MKFFGTEIGLSGGVQSGSQSMSGSGTQTSKLNITQEGFDKIVQDIMGSEQGLAQLLQGQSVAGLYGASTNTLLAQDFVSSLAGELAKVTAENVTTKEEQSQTKSKQKSLGAKTVICTELERQGLLNTELYEAGHSHFLSLHARTVRGYRVWANKVVPLMQKSQALSVFLAPIANARYEHVTGRRKNLIGWITVHVCQPICYLIGIFVPEGEEYGHQATVY